MKKNIVKSLIIFLIILFTSTSVYAFGVNDLNGSSSPQKVNDLGNNAITIISTIGSIISVIVLVILGLKYMIGSVEEKAEYKKTLLPYVIGATLVFAASSIAGIIYNVAINL